MKALKDATIAEGPLIGLFGSKAAYSENRHESENPNFVTTALLEELKPILEPLGFAHKGSPRLSLFEHRWTRWYLKFPPAPLSFGGTYVDASKCAVLSTPAGNVRIITATHSVMDRLSDSAEPAGRLLGRPDCHQGKKVVVALEPTQ
jgi:hypothetical protein